jgi:hypothetical protein
MGQGRDRTGQDTSGSGAPENDAQLIAPEVLMSRLDDAEQKEKSPIPPKEKLQTPREARATRLPKDWKPSAADLEFARKLLPENLIEHEVGKFSDYWCAKPANATKLDWAATWRNWCRKASEGLSSRPPPEAPQLPFPSVQLVRTRGGKNAAFTEHPAADWRRRNDDRHAA